MRRVWRRSSALPSFPWAPPPNSLEDHFELGNAGVTFWTDIVILVNRLHPALASAPLRDGGHCAAPFALALPKIRSRYRAD
jgi:hypothetical protein